MEYRRNNLPASGDGSVGWTVFSMIVALLLLLIGLPALLIGFCVQRFTARVVSSWRLRFILWFVLFAGSIAIEYRLYQQDLIQLVTRELTAYALVVRHYQADFNHWPFRALWSATWPIWLQTLPGIGIVGFWQEISAQSNDDTARQLQQKERNRRRSIERRQRKARKRTSRPHHTPHEAGGMMVIGVPIKNEEQE
ncbi:MAG TPA: hypothetical protein VFB60_11350 [Ktedonobacteraceae bacterium]|nr:hypothetical protein [Ktedonobacteraceae bacterium]